ncbi:MAG TPA: metal ABC transporter permease [Alphaproteobacteria bacterium]|nr:metal ABC transporter permease [Alphaproteobacteria bacterium]
MNGIEFLQIDLPAILAAVLACTVCALHGNFLVLRRQALLGDAISHVVLPGIVIAFLVGGSRAGLPTMLGAAAAAVVAALLIALIQRLGRIESGASMGVVFTVLFALGIVLIEQAAARSVDLDPDCVLYGQLEDILWLVPQGWGDLLSPAIWATLPREVVTLAAVLLLSVLFALLFHKELKLTAFDPGLARSLGIPAGAMQAALTGFVALSAIAAFEAVGSILVIAMLICPAAAARLITDRYGTQMGLSLLFGAGAGLLGYGLAGPLPLALGAGWSLNAAGSIAVVAGLILGAAVLLGRHGALARRRFAR